MSLVQPSFARPWDHQLSRAPITRNISIICKASRRPTRRRSSPAHRKRPKSPLSLLRYKAGACRPFRRRAAGCGARSRRLPPATTARASATLHPRKERLLSGHRRGFRVGSSSVWERHASCSDAFLDCRLRPLFCKSRRRSTIGPSMGSIPVATATLAGQCSTIPTRTIRIR